MTQASQTDIRKKWWAWNLNATVETNVIDGLLMSSINKSSKWGLIIFEQIKSRIHNMSKSNQEWKIIHDSLPKKQNFEHRLMSYDNCFPLLLVDTNFISSRSFQSWVVLKIWTWLIFNFCTLQWNAETQVCILFNWNIQMLYHQLAKERVIGWTSQVLSYLHLRQGKDFHSKTR